MPASWKIQAIQRRFGKALPSGHQSKVTMPQCHSRCATDAWKSQKVLLLQTTVVASKSCKMKTFDPFGFTATVKHRCCSCLSIQALRFVQIRGWLWDMFTLTLLVQFFKNIWVKRIIALSLKNSKTDDDAKEGLGKQDTSSLGTLWWLMLHSPKQSSNFLCEKILENGDIDQCSSCRCGHLFCACSCLFFGLGELGWYNQLEPGHHRALLKSLKVCLSHTLYWQKCEGEVVTSLGEVKAFSWSQHGFPSADQFAKQMFGYKQTNSHRVARRRWANKRQSLVGWTLPIVLPSWCLPPCRHPFTAASSCSLALRAHRSPAYICHMPWENESVIKAFNNDASTTDTRVSSAWDRSSRKMLFQWLMCQISFYLLQGEIVSIIGEQ